MTQYGDPMHRKDGFARHEVMILDTEAVAMTRILLREQVRFAVRPEANGWMRVRAWFDHDSLNTTRDINAWAQEARSAS